MLQSDKYSDERNEELAEQVHKYKVYTNMRTLLKLRVLLKQIGLEKLLSSGKLESGDIVSSAMALLNQNNLLNEFCQTVTNTTADFMEEEIGTVMWVFNDFFVCLYWQMPPSWRQAVNASIQAMISLGKAELAKEISKIGGMIPDSGLTASE